MVYRYRLLQKQFKQLIYFKLVSQQCKIKLLHFNFTVSATLRWATKHVTLNMIDPTTSTSYLQVESELYGLTIQKALVG